MQGPAGTGPRVADKHRALLAYLDARLYLVGMPEREAVARVLWAGTRPLEPLPDRRDAHPVDQEPQVQARLHALEVALGVPLACGQD